MYHLNPDSIFIFQEISPPLVDDFIYLCDDAYKHDEMLQWERDILKTLNYDINYPVAYRFLRRLAKVNFYHLRHINNTRIFRLLVSPWKHTHWHDTFVNLPYKITNLLEYGQVILQQLRCI